jgi:hypothetical protein
MQESDQMCTSVCISLAFMRVYNRTEAVAHFPAMATGVA